MKEYYKRFQIKETVELNELHPRIKSILKQMDEDPLNIPSAKELMEQNDMSPSHWATNFVQSIGISPTNLLTNRRWFCINEDLVENDLTLNEIAEKYGFTNNFSLTNLIKKRTGLTYIEYKAKVSSVPLTNELFSTFKRLGISFTITRATKKLIPIVERIDKEWLDFFDVPRVYEKLNVPKRLTDQISHELGINVRKMTINRMLHEIEKELKTKITFSALADKLKFSSVDEMEEFVKRERRLSLNEYKREVNTISMRDLLTSKKLGIIT